MIRLKRKENPFLEFSREGMTELILEQIRTIIVMSYCGMTSGLIIDVFRLFISRFIEGSYILKIIIKIFCCIAIAFLIGDFIFYCQNGKITFLGMAAFTIGLLLWRKFFCDIIYKP